MYKPLIWAALIGAAMTGPADAKSNAPLAGQWGGDRAMLTVTAQGGRLEQDCALGTMAGPVHLDAAGRFRTHGTYEADKPGPQRADAVPTQAIFSGTVRGGSLQLTVEQPGAPVRHFTLDANHRVKLIRCL